MATDIKPLMDIEGATCEEFVEVYGKWYDIARHVLRPEQRKRINLTMVKLLTEMHMEVINADTLNKYIKESEYPFEVFTSLKTVFASLPKGHPLKSLTCKNKSIKIRETVTEMDFERIAIKYSHGYKKRERLLVIYLAWYTGMAIVDCCNLKWASVDLDTGMIRIFRQKTGSLSTIPLEMGGQLHKLLQEFKERKDPSPFVSPENHEQYENHARVVGNINFTMKLLGFAHGNGVHAFRRSFITRLISRGVDVTTIQKMTGHKDPKQMAVYFTPSDEQLRTALYGKEHASEKLPRQVRPIKPEGLPAPRKEWGQRKKYGRPFKPGNIHRFGPGGKKRSVAEPAGQLGKNTGGDNESIPDGVRSDASQRSGPEEISPTDNARRETTIASAEPEQTGSKVPEETLRPLAF